MYHTRVLEGNLPLVLVAPILWGPLVESVVLEEGGGLPVIVDDVEEFVKDIAGELVDNVLEDVVMEVAKEVACEVCFEEDAPNVWEFRRRGSA